MKRVSMVLAQGVIETKKQSRQWITPGMKISVAFAVLVAIVAIAWSLVLRGAIGERTITSGQGGKDLSQSGTSNDLELCFFKVLRDMNKYSRSGNKAFFDRAMERCKRIENSLMKALESERGNMGLEYKTLKSAAYFVRRYIDLTKEKIKYMDATQELTCELLKASGIFSDECGKLLAKQNKILEEEIKSGVAQGVLIDRFNKISATHDIIDLSSEITSEAWRSISQHDMDLFKNATSKIGGLGAKLSHLAKDTKANDESLQTVVTCLKTTERFFDGMATLYGNLINKKELENQSEMMSNEVLTALSAADQTGLATINHNDVKIEGCLIPGESVSGNIPGAITPMNDPYAPSHYPK